MGDARWNQHLPRPHCAFVKGISLPERLRVAPKVCERDLQHAADGPAVVLVKVVMKCLDDRVTRQGG
jgi:hypothetical protein